MTGAVSPFRSIITLIATHVVHSPLFSTFNCQHPRRHIPDLLLEFTHGIATQGSKGYTLPQDPSVEEECMDPHTALSAKTKQTGGLRFWAVRGVLSSSVVWLSSVPVSLHERTTHAHVN